jgi:two-component system, NarL family, response regulator
MGNTQTAHSCKHVAIVDDDDNTRLCFQDILQSTENFSFAGSFSNGPEALAGIPRLQPDLTLMDIRLPGLNGIECTRRLKRILPRLKIVIVTGTHNVDFVDASLQAGAVAYLFKPIVGDQLLATLRFAALNQAGNPDKVENEFLSAKPSQANLPLSPREREVLAGLADGLLYKEISQKLGVSYATVHKHQHNIFKKLHVSNRSEAIRIWLNKRND